MSNVLDTAILFGKESTYGTPVTLTHAYEGKADSWKRAQERIESTGFYAGMHAKRSDRIVTVNMGGEGTLEFDILNKGFGLILQAMLGSVSGPTQIAATTAYKTTVATTAADPDDSFTVQVQRTDMGGTQRDFTHEGCVVTGWNISQDVGGLLKASLNFDFEDVNTVMRGSGAAVMGTATVEGQDRARRAVEAALQSPLLEDNDIRGAQHILLNISSGKMEVTMDEVFEITEYIQEEAGQANLIWGNCFDESLGDKLSVTVCADRYQPA